MRRCYGLWFVLALLSAGLCACRARPVAAPDYWPTEAWRVDALERHGFEQPLHDAIAARIPQLPFLNGLLIIRHGYIIHESYYNGYDADTLHHIASVTKSWTSAAVGIAHDDGLLADLDAPLSTLLPAHFATGEHKDKGSITLRHLLQMRSGIDFDEEVLNTGGYGGEELLTSDLTTVSLDFPVAQPPGTSWNYSTLDTQLISAILQEVSGQSLATFADTKLFTPLGIDDFEWQHDGLGTTIGGQNLSMTPRDMAKLGFLYLHGGIWEDKQLLSKAWVDESLTAQNERLYFPVTGREELIEWYGYHWYVWKGEWFFGYRSFQASGYGGQQVLVFPELDMMLVTTSNLTGVDPATDEQQRTALNSLFLEVIFPALTDARASR